MCGVPTEYYPEPVCIILYNTQYIDNTCIVNLCRLTYMYTPTTPDWKAKCIQTVVNRLTRSVAIKMQCR